MRAANRHQQHHYVPAFLLRQWQSGPDERLTAFAWKNGNLVASRNKARAVAKLLGLYTLQEAPSEQRNMLESKLFQLVDDHAARVHAALLRGDLQKLTQEDAEHWARFVVSLTVRSPWLIERYAARGPGVMLRAMMDRPVPGEDAHERLAQFQAAHPAALRDLTLRSVGRVVVQSEAHAHLLGAVWSLVDTSQSSRDLVISDVPVYRSGVKDGDFLLALPLAPKRLFMIHPQGSRIGAGLRTIPVRDLVTAANRESAAQAMQYVFASSGEHETLARRMLRKPLEGPSRG
jgi:hypothetical protein